MKGKEWNYVKDLTTQLLWPWYSFVAFSCPLHNLILVLVRVFSTTVYYPSSDNMTEVVFERTVIPLKRLRTRNVS